MAGVVGLACNSHLVSVSQAYPCIVTFVLFDLLYFQDLSKLRALLSIPEISDILSSKYAILLTKVW